VVDVGALVVEAIVGAQDGNLTAILPRFGAEELVTHLQQGTMGLAVVAWGKEGNRLLRALRAHDGLSRILEGAALLEDDGADEAVPTDLDQYLEQLAARALPPDAWWGPCLVLGVRRPGDGDDRILVGQLVPWPGNHTNTSGTPLPAGLAENVGDGARANGHGGNSQRVSSPADWDLTEWGLAPLLVNTQNPPFEWPAHFERDAREALLVEARYVDVRHQQLSVILGKGVKPGNVLEVMRGEAARAEAEEEIESIFVTVRHDFAVMNALLADGEWPRAVPVCTPRDAYAHDDTNLSHVSLTPSQPVGMRPSRLGYTLSRRLYHLAVAVSSPPPRPTLTTRQGTAYTTRPRGARRW
jgi:hypothetical protein